MGTSSWSGAKDDDTAGYSAGSAYVYDLASANPDIPIATFNNPTPDEYDNDNFGFSVAVSGDIVVVGDVDDNTGAFAAGSAFVYDLASANPDTPIATLNNPTPAGYDGFGISVAVNGDIVVVGVYSDDTDANNAGSAYVYDLASADPNTPIATLSNPTQVNAIDDRFGFSVAATEDIIVVGAISEDTGAPAAGSAYVYSLTSANLDTPILTLNNPDPDNFDEFGISVAAADDIVVVGAANARAAYVYDLNSASPDTPIVPLGNPIATSGDEFGNSVAVSGDIVVVGAYRDHNGAEDAGSAACF